MKCSKLVKGTWMKHGEKVETVKLDNQTALKTAHGGFSWKGNGMEWMGMLAALVPSRL